MTSLRGQASWFKMTSLRGKLTALACHPTKFVNKPEQRTFLSTNIEFAIPDGAKMPLIKEDKIVCKVCTE
jgi:hypothetical protein